MLQPTGMAVLAALGCLEPVLARGARVTRLLCENENRVKVIDLAYEAVGAGTFGLGLHRGVLFDTLYSAVGAAAVDIHPGMDIVRTAMRRGKRWLIEGDGNVHGPFDLVVVCDGARSKIRDAMGEVSKRVSPYPWGALWFIGKDPDQTFRGVLHQRVRGTRDMVGLLPTGRGPDGDVEETSLFFSVRRDEVATWLTRGLAAWKEHVVSIAPESAPLLAQVNDIAELTFAGYFDVTMPRWHAPGVVFLGDAAHATSPQLGQGCNLALCDARVLDRTLRGATSLGDALSDYTARRARHLGFYQLATRGLTPFFQSDVRAFGGLRDLFMGRASRFAFVEREMVRTMCGTKSGILTGTFDPDEA